MPRIKALAYVGCKVSDLSAWDRFLKQVFGLTEYVDTGGGSQRFHLDGGEQWIELEQSSTDSLNYIGWEVDSREELEAFAQTLKDHGIKVSPASEQLQALRGASDLLLLSGPDNVPTELFVRSPDRRSAHSASGLQLGHVVLASADRQASVEWYEKVFGLKLSDNIFWDGVEASFMRCSPRHHSLALTNLVGDMRGGDLGHFMLESGALDDVGRAYDAVRAAGIPLAFTFGRHSNDGAISFYVYSPSGWLVEYGYGGRVFDQPDSPPGFYDAPSIWGHVPQPPPGGDQTKQRY
jgi:2,3-dihydroxybiphenyl 1,2-dioxygenase